MCGHAGGEGADVCLLNGGAVGDGVGKGYAEFEYVCAGVDGGFYEIEACGVVGVAYYEEGDQGASF